jgi:16S rRNA (uracil1498-N3)-methyltransferase
MSDRFYSEQPITGDRATLDGSEAHHLLHVMRAGVGDRVTLFDGSGAEFDAEVIAAGRADVELAVSERREVDRELPFGLTIGVALPKGDRQKWLVEKLTELGVTRLIPLTTVRGVAQPNGNALIRLERSVVEASKQCGRNRLLTIEPATEWESFVHASRAAQRWIAHPDGAPFAELSRDAGADVVIAVGPEGGFTDEEVALAAAAGWQRVALGRRILRVETAAVALAAAIALT